MFSEGSGEAAFHPLIGNVLEEIAVSNDGETTLRFKMKDVEGLHFVSTEGDCCSESWWADILGAKDSMGGEVLDIKTLEMLDRLDDNRTRQESDIAYGYMIVTTLGAITVVFRNSSNGYYGGWCFGGSYWGNHKDGWKVIESNAWSA